MAYQYLVDNLSHKIDRTRSDIKKIANNCHDHGFCRTVFWTDFSKLSLLTFYTHTLLVISFSFPSLRRSKTSIKTTRTKHTQSIEGRYRIHGDLKTSQQGVESLPAYACRTCCCCCCCVEAPTRSPRRRSPASAREEIPLVLE